MRGFIIRFFKGLFRLDRLVGFAILGATLALYVSNPYPVQFTRAKAFDFYQQMKPREIPAPEKQMVTIVDIDETSLHEIGQWPWSRLTLAKIVVELINQGAAVVAFDMVFAEPDRTSPAGVVESLFNLDEATREAILKLPDNDVLLASVVGKRVVLGQAGYWDELPNDAGPPVHRSLAERSRKDAVKPTQMLVNVPTLVRNLSVIEKAAPGHGMFSLSQQLDGIIRRVPLVFNHNGNLYPSLAVEALRVAFGTKTLMIDMSKLGIEGLLIAPKSKFPGGLRIDTDKFGEVWPYFSYQDTSKYLSAVDVLNGTADPARIKGKLIFIGTSAVGLQDIRSTPLSPVLPGVEVHAQIVENAFLDTFLKRPPYMAGAEVLMIAFGGLMMIWLVPSAGAKWTLLVFAVLGGGAGGLSWYMFSEERFLLDPTIAVASMFILYSTLTYLNFSREEAQKKQTRSAFSKYLSPDMVEAVAADPGKLKLGGDKRDMTLLFCDVRGFTTISEQFDAEGLTRLINKLLTPLTNAILERKGTVDKYMGDCVMAFWNAPLDDAEHAKHGCLSALAMLEEIGPLNERLKVEAKEEGRKHIPIKVGVGLNSGECVVGNMGSDQRFDYSVLGDAVNLASRLEGQSKTYGVRTVIGESTCLQVPTLATFELDLIKVKGKLEAVRIFCLLGGEDMAATAEFKAFKTKIDDMLAAYRDQDWAGAKEILDQAREMAKPHDIDGLFDLYDGRIAEGQANPPGEDWDGVFVATSK